MILALNTPCGPLVNDVDSKAGPSHSALKVLSSPNATSASLGNKGEDENLSPYAFTKSKNIELLENHQDTLDSLYVVFGGVNYSIYRIFSTQKYLIDFE